jgi:hypothetical protein
MLAVPRLSEVVVGRRKPVAFSEEYLDKRGGGEVSKASRVIDFVRSNPDVSSFNRIFPILWLSLGLRFVILCLLFGGTRSVV